MEEANRRCEGVETQLIESKNLLLEIKQEVEQYVMVAEQQLLESRQEIRELTADNARLSKVLKDMEMRAELAESKDKLLEAQQTAQEAEHRATAAERRIQELSGDITRLGEDLQHMERRAQLAEQKSHDLETQWVVQRSDIQMTERQLGGGGWGSVKVAKFCGIEVAAKSLYEQIRCGHYEHLFIREMNMAARLRHPNLVQFIGATLEGEMIILTELMHTSLRRVLEQGHISREHTVSISVQVCQALNYLHMIRPDPVIHVTSAVQMSSSTLSPTMAGWQRSQTMGQ